MKKKIIIPIIVIILLIGIVVIISSTNSNAKENNIPLPEYASGVKISDIVKEDIANKLATFGVNIEKTKSNGVNKKIGNGESYIIKSDSPQETINIYIVDNNVASLLAGNTNPGEKEIDGNKYWIYKNLLISLPSNTTFSDSIKNSLI